MKKVLLLSLLVLLTGTSPLMAKHHKSVQIPAQDLKWIPNPERPDNISMAAVWGDPMKGAHGAFHKFKAGATVENHSHSATFKAVVIEGTVVTGPEDSPKTLGPGSFFIDGAKENHITKCEGTTDCIFYVESSGKFDLKMAKKTAK